YYWRDYHGTLPNDAVLAGIDSQGQPVYIGLVYIRGFELLPATFYPVQGIARTTAYSSILEPTENIRILCSPHPEAFEWLSIQSKDLQYYTYLNLIPGGNEVGENLYIGRVFRDNGAIIGKIFRHERDNRGIWFPYGKGPANSLTYEILAYNCAKVFYPKMDTSVKTS
ncbi:uncharacterized protein BDFB_011470, partial [Asbolus verrucosus]